MTLTIVLSALAVVSVLVLIVVVLTRGGLAHPKPERNDQALTLMQQQVDALRKQVGDSLTASTSLISQQMNEVTRQVNQQLGSITQQFQGTTATISQRLDKAAEVIGGVQKGLGELTGATQRIHDVGKDIAQLQEILRAPKLRGGLGELLLSDLIAQILPQDYYELQHKFKSGETVDAIIKLGQGTVPVDAKFPLENFRKLLTSPSDEERLACRKAFGRDVKKHIDDVARKYILPDEGTFDFALLYIPAENVYYETIIKDESFESETISSYALKRKVIPVSPNSFYAYLQAITVGLRGLRIEKQAAQIMAFLQRLNADFARFKDDFALLGRHLVNARSKYEDSEKRLVRFEDKLGSARGDGDTIPHPVPIPDPPQVESPPGQLPLE
jgi:DNA recombination protein RmuC